MEMPEIKILSMKEVDVHEYTDDVRVDRIKYALKRDGRMKNPVIVSKIGEKYMILDGATRHGALKKLGAKHIVVQVVDYDSDEMVLDTWDHAITGIQIDDYINKIKKIDGLNVEESFEAMAESSLQKKEILGYIITKEGKTYVLKCADDYESIIKCICEVTKAYTNEEETVRIVHSQVQSYLNVSKNGAAIFCTPMFTKKDIKEIFKKGLKVSAGITRHLIPCRVLGVNLGLNMLLNDDSTQSKNKYLKEFIEMNLKHGKIRYYSEPTIVFDS